VTIGSDPHRFVSDTKMIRRAIRKGWPVPEATRIAAIARMDAVVRRESVPTILGDGAVFQDEGKADAHAIAAAKTLVAMTAFDQAEEHHQDNLNKPAAGTTVNVGVQVGGTSDASIALFYVESGIPEKMPPALLERYKAGEFD